MPAPRGDVSGKRIAMPSFAAGPRKLPFCALAGMDGPQVSLRHRENESKSGHSRVIFRAGQAREVEEDGNLALGRIRRQEEVELRVEVSKY